MSFRICNMTRVSVDVVLRCFVILSAILLAGVVTAQTKNSQRPAIPTHRVLSTSEFLSLLDTTYRFSSNLSPALKTQDTAAIIQELMTHFVHRTSPRYFFEPGDAPRRAREFKSLYPDTTAAMKNDADAFIMRYGADVDWVLSGKDKTGKAHTPNVVRFLARQRYAESIALQYLFLHDESYVSFLLSHIDDFSKDFDAGKVEKGGNDIFERFYGGHRMRNWLSVYHLLFTAEGFTSQKKILTMKVLFATAAKIYDQCKKFNYGNHQLVGAEALYEVTLMFPEFPVMREWNAQAKKIIIEHIDKEIAADGFQCERSSHYHKLDIVNYLRFYRLSVLNNIEVPRSFSLRFRNMFSAMANAAMPNRRMPILQDVSDSATVREDQIADEMSLGALIFNEPQFKYFGSKVFPASYYWFFTSDDVRRYENIPTAKPDIGSTALDNTGYYIMRSNWDSTGMYMLIDAGLSPNKPDHTHGGVLGIIAASHGEQFLPNYPVRYSEASYAVLKNSYAKNVAIVDSLEQARGWIGNAAKTGFGKWAFLPRPKVNGWIPENTFDYFSASHDAYDSIGVGYSRSIVHRKGKYWVVVDDFRSTLRSHTYQQIWQGAYTVDFTTHCAIQKMGQAELVIVQSGNDITATKTEVAGLYPSLWFQKVGGKNFRFTTLLFPRLEGDTTMPVMDEFRRDGNDGLVVSIGAEKDSLFFNGNRLRVVSAGKFN